MRSISDYSELSKILRESGAEETKKAENNTLYNIAHFFLIKKPKKKTQADMFFRPEIE